MKPGEAGSILVVDDDEAVGTVLVALLRQAGSNALHMRDGPSALRALQYQQRRADVVVTDLRMPGMDGLQLLREILGRWSDLPVIVLTAHGTVALAVEAMRAGATDFLLKPFDSEQIVYVVHKALQASRHADARVAGAPIAETKLSSGSPAMRPVLDVIARAAASTTTVLVRGESGTGKELAARAIHDLSPRRAGPFVAIHCAALPEALLESELFGYEKGAFTGAACRKPGRIELASGGTLFLDEIGDVPLQVQVKLLRVLQERRIERLGGTQSIEVDVRIVAATHQDLDAMVQARTFREDLYYRLNVIPVVMPPLRDRPGDIEALVVQFATTFGEANGRGRVVVEPEAIERLKVETWPGNVRQLQNFVERLVVLSDGASITLQDVERELARSSTLASSAPPSSGSMPATLGARRSQAEREALREALARVQGNRTLAARILGVSRRTLYNMLTEYGLG